MSKREYQRNYLLKNRERNRQITTAIKMYLGCFRCGYREHPAALDYHHTDPATKARQVGGYDCTVAGLMREVAKCEVLCACCHRIEHAEKNSDDVLT